MSSKFMKSAAVLGTVTLASLLLVACGSKPAEKLLILVHLKRKKSLFTLKTNTKLMLKQLLKLMKKKLEQS